MKMSPWVLHNELTLHEAASLAIDISPNAWFEPEFIPMEYAPMVDAFKKAILSNELKAKVIGAAGEVVVEGGSVVEAFCFSEKDWKSLQIKKGNLIEWFETKGFKPAFFFPDNEVHSTKKAPDGSEIVKPLDPRKETTLYCLIAVLAGKLGYSPDDKDTVGKIKTILDLAGVPMDKKTIRYNIKAAFGALNSKME